MKQESDQFGVDNDRTAGGELDWTLSKYQNGCH